MARSSYVYILFNRDGDVLVPFTVKHEMQTFVMQNKPVGAYCVRYRDGQLAEPVDIDFLRK